MSSTTLPKAMKAITIHGKRAKVAQVPLPKLRPTYLLAKIDSVALNPTDWKHIANGLAAPGGISGCDFAGTVVEVGPDVSKDVQPGDRIAGTTHGANFSQPEDGCFAEYAMAKADLVVKIPNEMSFETAATFPLGTATVGQGLFQKALKLDLPSASTKPAEKNGEAVLIYGGSSATGSLAIQFARLAGYRVLTTCSPHNNSYVSELGADAVFDYNDPDCGAAINRATNNSLRFAWDTIAQSSSAQICAEALSSSPDAALRYGSTMPVSCPRKDVTSTATLMYTIFNEAFVKGGSETPKTPEDFEFAKKMFALTEQLLHAKQLSPHPEKVGELGLEGVLKGLKEMKAGKVSGVKLVYRVRDTPDASEAEVEF
nr:protein toxd [Quercus suber]